MSVVSPKGCATRECGSFVHFRNRHSLFRTIALIENEWPRRAQHLLGAGIERELDDRCLFPVRIGEPVYWHRSPRISNI